MTDDPTTTRSGSITGGSNNPDYYEFRLTGTRQVDLTLSGLTGNLNLRLEGSSGSLIDSSAGSGTGNEEISEVLGAGTYYIKVDVADASSAVSDIISAFSLQVEVSATTTIIGPIIIDPPDPVVPSSSISLPGDEVRYSTTSHSINWDTSGSGLLLLGGFFTDGNERYLVEFRISGLNGSVRLFFSLTDVRDSGDDVVDNFTEDFRTTGIIRFSVSGASVTLTPPITDTTEPYSWSPANASEVETFAEDYEDGDDLTIRFSSPVPVIAPLPSGLAFLNGNLYSIDTAGTLFRHENFNSAGTKSLTTLTNSGTALAGKWESLGVWNGNLYGVVGQQLRQITVTGDTYTVGASLGNLRGGGVQQPPRLFIADAAGAAGAELYELDPDGADSQGEPSARLAQWTGPATEAMAVLNNRLLIADFTGD